MLLKDSNAIVFSSRIVKINPPKSLRTSSRNEHSAKDINKFSDLQLVLKKKIIPENNKSILLTVISRK